MSLCERSIPGCRSSLPEEHQDAWLSGEAKKEILVPFPADRNEGVADDARVISSKNNDAEIIAPIELNTGRDLAL
jgi:hypothetical protein